MADPVELAEALRLFMEVLESGPAPRLAEPMTGLKVPLAVPDVVREAGAG